jgi:cystine transport system substrate-binding protein
MTRSRQTVLIDLEKRRTLKAGLFLGLTGSVVSGNIMAENAALTVGFLNNYLPYSFVDAQGRLKGFDVDVVTRLAEVMSVKLDIVTEGLAKLNKKLKIGEVMFIGNQLLATPENKREYDFVKPYASIQMVSVVHEEDNRDFLSLDDFFGKKLGVLTGTGVEEQAKNVIGKSVISYERIEDALQALAQKKLDAVLEESLIVEYFIERDNLPVKVAAPFASPVNVGLVVNKANKAMQAKLNQAVQTILNDGSFKLISNRWFGYDVSRSRVGHAAGS